MKYITTNEKYSDEEIKTYNNRNAAFIVKSTNSWWILFYDDCVRLNHLANFLTCKRYMLL